MSPERLNILYVSQMPASPPRFGAQARMHGLMTQLARRHDLTAAMLVDDEFDADECRRAMQAYCREVVMVPNPYSRPGLAKRLLQVRSLASIRSFERLRVTLPELRQSLDRILRAKRFDVVNLEFPYLGHYDLRQAPPGEKRPALVVDSHEIAHDLARQFARVGGNVGRRVYAGANWRKLRREELGTYRDADGVYLCSAADERRLLNEAPGVRTAVVPNAADVEYFQPRPTDPPPDGRTVVYFGLLSTVPNIDARSPFCARYLATHRRGVSRRSLQDYRRPTAAVASGAGRAQDRADGLRVRLAAAPCCGCGRCGPAAPRRRHASQDRRGHGHGEGHYLDHARRRRDRGGPRARHPCRRSARWPSRTR